MAAAPGSVWAKIGFEFPALVCVNVFVLISGWFGIRASARGAMSFVFQCLYFGLLLYFVGCIDSGVLPNVLGIAQVLTLFKVNWFITAYLILYSFAPVLNGFAGNVGRRQLAMVTLVFFLMEFWMQFVSVAGFYSGGYSPIAFFGIYLLGRTMRVYSAELSRRSAGFYFWIYVVSTVCSGGLCGLFLMYGKPNMAYKMQFYNNPMIIVGAGALLLAFTRIRMPYNKGVNRIAKSTLPCFCSILMCRGDLTRSCGRCAGSILIFPKVWLSGRWLSLSLRSLPLQCCLTSREYGCGAESLPVFRSRSTGFEKRMA